MGLSNENSVTTMLNGKRKSPRLKEGIKLSASPDIKEVKRTRNNPKTNSVVQNGKFIEPDLAPPTPSYTGLPLEEGPSVKIKKESLWKRKNDDPDLSLVSEQPYQSKLTKLNKVEQSGIRNPLKPMKQKQPNKKLKLTLKTPQQPDKNRLKKIKIISPSKIASTKLLDTKINISKNNYNEENDDFCYACGLPGIFICCETCPKSFHFLCCDPPIEEPPEDDWFCKECYAKKFPFFIRDYSDYGIFDKLLNQLEIRDKKCFQLPKELREDTFVGVKTEDNGDYIDDTMKENQKVSKKPDSQINGFNRNIDLEIESLYDAKGNPYLCHKCGLSGQNHKTLIHCDYCPLVYHIDCLDPPMFGPKTIGDKWKCPNHLHDLLPRGFPKLRQFKETQLIENSLQSNFLKIASMGNIVVKLVEEEQKEAPLIKEEIKPPLIDWGKDMNAIHPNYQPQQLINVDDNGVHTSSYCKSVVDQMYQVKEKSILIDFINKSKQAIVDDLEHYNNYSRIESNPSEQEFVENIAELKSRQPKLNLDALLKVISDTNPLPRISQEEVSELMKIKRLMEAKGQEKLLQFLKS